MVSTVENEADFKPGDRVIYRRLTRDRQFVEQTAEVVRVMEVNGRPMVVILVDRIPVPRTVGAASVRLV